MRALPTKKGPAVPIEWHTSFSPGLGLGSLGARASTTKNRLCTLSGPKKAEPLIQDGWERLDGHQGPQTGTCTLRSGELPRTLEGKEPGPHPPQADLRLDPTMSFPSCVMRLCLFPT